SPAIALSWCSPVTPVVVPLVGNISTVRPERPGDEGKGNNSVLSLRPRRLSPRDRTDRVVRGPGEGPDRWPGNRRCALAGAVASSTGSGYRSDTRSAGRRAVLRGRARAAPRVPV